MKVKLLLGLTIATFISANSFALEIYKGKLIKHKEWATGGAIGSFKSVALNPSNFKKHTMSTTKNSEPFLQTYSFSQHADAATGENRYIVGNHGVYISNFTDTEQTYKYLLSLCAETSPKDMKCLYWSDELILEPGGYASSGADIYIQNTYTTPGSYSVYSATTAFNENPSSDVAVFESRAISRSTIDVTGNKG